MMTRLTLATGLAAAMLAATSAFALDNRSMRRDSGMRISASFQTSVPVTGPMSVEEEARATETARKALYQIAARECDVITQVFKGECRMLNLNVRSFTQERGNGIRQISVSANASYIVAAEQADDEGKKL